MYGAFKDHLQNQLNEIESNGIFKRERVITTPQGAVVKVKDGKEVIIFCANNFCFRSKLEWACAKCALA